MADFLGDFAAGASVVLWWNTNAIAGESITRATDGSIRIYKGSSDTQRSSSAGITDTEDADGVTGVHRLSIDLSDNTDAGFYAAGSDYAVVLVGADIDGKTVNHALGQFSIENRNNKVNLVQWLGVAPLALTAQKVNSVLDPALEAKIAAIGTSAAYAVSPTIAANTVRIVRGDDYASADARAIDLVYSGQPDFTSATNVTMKIVSSNNRVATTLATWTGSVVNATTLRFTPTDTDTALLPAINSQTQITYPFEVSLTLASGSVITPTSLHAGKLLVDAQAT